MQSLPFSGIPSAALLPVSLLIACTFLGCLNDPANRNQLTPEQLAFHERVLGHWGAVSITDSNGKKMAKGTWSVSILHRGILYTETDCGSLETEFEWLPGRRIFIGSWRKVEETDFGESYSPFPTECFEMIGPNPIAESAYSFLNDGSFHYSIHKNELRIKNKKGQELFLSRPKDLVFLPEDFPGFPSWEFPGTMSEEITRLGLAWKVWSQKGFIDYSYNLEIEYFKQSQRNYRVEVRDSTVVANIPFGSKSYLQGYRSTVPDNFKWVAILYRQLLEPEFEACPVMVKYDFEYGYPEEIQYTFNDDCGELSIQRISQMVPRIER